MKVTYTAPNNEQFVQVNDVGDVKTPLIRLGGVRLYDGVQATLPDSEEVRKSLESGELKDLLDAGQITVDVDSTYAPLVNHHEVEATAAQTVVTLPVGKTYVPGNNSLDVYVDGTLQPKPTTTGTPTYAETSASVITFVTPMTGGEDLQFRWWK